MVAPLDLVGQRFGRLEVLRRVESDRWGRTRWFCRCDCGTEKVTNRIDLRNGDARSCGCYALERRAEANTDPDSEILYGGAHDRVHRERGPAREHPCACGCGRRAEDWALLHGAPGRRQQHQPGRDHGAWLSANPFEYQPMAKSCHKLYDNARRRELAEAAS